MDLRKRFSTSKAVPFLEQDHSLGTASIMHMMPFQSTHLEQAFLQHFHSSRAMYDVAVGIMGIGMMAHWFNLWVSVKNICLLGMASQILIIALAFHQEYGRYRPYVVHFHRLFVAYGFHTLLLQMVANKPDCSFLGAGTSVFFSSNRARDLLLISLLYPLPMRGASLTTHTFVAGLFMTHLGADCRYLGGLPAYQRFAAQWAGLHETWRGEGTEAMCREFVHLLSDEAVPLRWLYRLGCPAVLPGFLATYGGHWSRMCLLHRLVWLPMGYAFPLVALYVWELRDRWLFARKMGIRVPNIQSCLLRGVFPVLQEASINIITAVLVLSPE